LIHHTFREGRAILPVRLVVAVDLKVLVAVHLERFDRDATQGRFVVNVRLAPVVLRGNDARLNLLI
jgi:hypothetical protein